jgi:hypothetical protein
MEAVKRTPTVPSRLRAACHRERVLLYSIVTCYEGVGHGMYQDDPLN